MGTVGVGVWVRVGGGVVVFVVVCVVGRSACSGLLVVFGSSVLLVFRPASATVCLKLFRCVAGAVCSSVVIRSGRVYSCVGVFGVCGSGLVFAVQVLRALSVFERSRLICELTVCS